MKRRSLVLAAILLLAVQAAFAQERSIVVASTTSTEQSGLFGFLLPRFSAKAGIQVKVVAVGTGQALDIGRRGDADVVFVHDRPGEEKFMADGFGVRRFNVMYNDFIVIGPLPDPAHIADGKDVIEAFRKIAAAKAPFISRGDRSGTNEAELRYWKETGIAINAAQDRWYREIGQDMGPALNVAASTNAYVLADRGTWLACLRSWLSGIADCSTNMVSCSSIRQSTRTSRRPTGRPLSIGWSHRRGKARLPNTRSTGSNCSFPMPKIMSPSLVVVAPAQFRLASPSLHPPRGEECGSAHPYAEQDED